MKLAKLPYHSQKGLSLIVVLVAGLVVFTAITLVKFSTLDSLQPDLRRIGLNVGTQSNSTPLANSETTNVNNNNGASNLNVAGNALDIDADVEIDSEGDNPLYIE